MDNKILTVIGAIMLIFLGKITLESDVLSFNKRQSGNHFEKTSMYKPSLKLQTRS
jgi:hypothetical protein